MTGEAKQEVTKLLRAGNRSGAIQYLNHTFNISTQDATTPVEAVEREISNTSQMVSESQSVSIPTLDEAIKTQVAQLLQTGRKSDAVKYVRKNLQLGSKEALVMVEKIAKENNPNYVSINLTGCMQTVAKGVGIFLMIVSFIFLAAAGMIYFFQYRSVSNSDRVTGKVTEMQSLDNGGSAPVVEFEWLEKKRSYASNYYTSPPDYEVGQTVSLYINREDTDDITLDTFSDRYAVIVGLSVPGAILLAISIGFLYFGRRKF